MSSSEIEVLSPGLFTTIQDLGRPQGRQYGLPPGGALDAYANRAANELVANPPHAATLEITLQGPKLHFKSKALIAITGAEMEFQVDRRPMPGWTCLFIRAGQILEFKGRKSGARAYLAVHGGFEAPLLLGSRATYTRARLGGYKGLGRPLKAGDILQNDESGSVFSPLKAGRTWQEDLRPAYASEVRVRVVPGPFEDYFLPSTFEILHSTLYRVGNASDRMGMRLLAPDRPLHFNSTDFELAPFGAVPGAIQVPPDGQPIILLAEHQVTGGYPVIGTVLTADLPLLAQLLPGNSVEFSRLP